MGDAVFYIQVSLTSGRHITSDRMNLRQFVGEVFSNSPHLSVESCWGYVEAHISKLMSHDSTVFLTVSNDRVYINPRHIESVKLIVV